MLSRRDFLRLSVLSSAGLIPSVWFAKNAQESTSDLRVESLSLEIPNLGKEFDGYRIGFVTDLHLSIYLPPQLIYQMIDKANELSLDLLISGGDHIWIPEHFYNRIAPIRNSKIAARCGVEQLELIYQEASRYLSAIWARDGRVAILGNHDNWFYPNILKRHLRQNNISLLSNSNFVIRRGSYSLEIYGVDDYWTGIPRLPKAWSLRDALRNRTRILVSHNPDFVSKAFLGRDNTFVMPELSLCGHTHGGQVILPFVGALRYNIRDLRLKRGLFRHGSSYVYTSRGIGVVEIPYRVRCPAELTLIELRSI